MLLKALLLHASCMHVLVNMHATEDNMHVTCNTFPIGMIPPWLYWYYWDL